MTEKSSRNEPIREHRVWSDLPFWTGLGLLGGFYVFLIAATLAADVRFTRKQNVELLSVFHSPEIRYAAQLSLFTSIATTLLSLIVAVPIGYLLSRFRPPENRLLGGAVTFGKAVFDALLDIPIVLPPLVIGLSLLILFNQTDGGVAAQAAFTNVMNAIGNWWDGHFGQWIAFPNGFRGITFAIPGVILAQFLVAAAFAVRTLRTAFDEISPRKEQVALTLGCTRAQAFRMVVLPEARRGLLAAATLTWARAMGEFGPILVFGGATRNKTEVLPTTVFLELSVGNLEAAVSVSLLMVGMAMVVLVAVRLLGRSDPLARVFR